MSYNEKRSLKVMIIEDEEDILFLYRDFLSNKGYNVVSCCLNADDVQMNIETCEPDICLIDYIIGGTGIGIDAGIQILKRKPSMPILFMTGYESIREELPKHPQLKNKNIQILMKPAKLSEIENALLQMVKV